MDRLRRLERRIEILRPPMVHVTYEDGMTGKVSVCQAVRLARKGSGIHSFDGGPEGLDRALGLLNGLLGVDVAID